MDVWRQSRDHYRRMSPSKQVLQALTSSTHTDSNLSEPVLSSLDSQQRFLDYIIRDPICVKFPASASYTTRVLKAVLDHLGSKYEVHEDLLDLYFTLSSAKPIEDGHMRNVIHKSWTLKVGDSQEDRVVTIRMADQLDSVGLTSWQAGFMLADFISANPELFDDKKCLELGSGVGLTGIVLAKAARPSRLCLTDYTQEVLTNMRTNASINDLQDLDIQQLDWEQFETNSETNSSLLPFLPDVILAADCVYDIGLIEKLCLVLKWCLERTESVQHPVAYIATTLRNPKTFQFFIDQLEKNKLDHEDVSATSKFDDLFGQPHTGIILSRITSRKLQ